MEFVSFDLAKKLKEKGLSCKYPLAMYNERGSFCPLFTSADRNPNIKSVFGNREYYDYDDFDENDFIAPTISQVLKWLREKHATHIEISLGGNGWYFEIIQYEYNEEEKEYYCKLITISVINDSYEQAAIAGIEYVLDNLI